MMRAVAFGLGVGLGWALWSARPPMVEAWGAGFGWLLLAALAICYYGGRARRGSAAVASASAHAEATAVAAPVQSVQVDVNLGAYAEAQRAAPGLDACVSEETIELADLIEDERGLEDLRAELELGADDDLPAVGAGQEASASRPVPKGVSVPTPVPRLAAVESQPSNEPRPGPQERSPGR